MAIGLAGVLGGAAVHAQKRRGARPAGPPAALPALGKAEMVAVEVEQITGTPSDAWAIGTHRVRVDWSSAVSNLLVHWDGREWSEAELPFQRTMEHRLLALWANGRDVWLSVITLPPQRDDDESARGRPDCTERGGQIFRRRNGKWQEIASSNTGAFAVHAIWGSGGDDVWMLDRPCDRFGQPGATIRRWDGKVLTDASAPPDIRDPRVIWGSGPRDVWIGGEGGVARWNGAAWRTFPMGKEWIHALGGTGPTDVWASGLAVRRWDGKSWTEVVRAPVGGKRLNTGIGWLAGAPGGHLFATDIEGNIYRSERAALSVIGRVRPWTSGQPRSPQLLQSWATGRDDLAIFVAGQARPPAMRWSKGKWTVNAPEPDVDAAEDVVALWSDGTTVWAAISFRVAAGDRAGEIRRWTDTGWQRAATLEQFPKRIWGLAPDDIWAVGLGGASWHWDGKRWSSVATGQSEHLYSVWGSGRQDVWAAGETGTLLRWDGTAWRLWSTLGAIDANTGVAALAGIGPDFVFAAGGHRVARWDGRGWNDAGGSEYPLGNGGMSDLFGLWGASRSDFWLVGTGADVGAPGMSRSAYYYNPLPTPYIVHWDGKLWKRTPFKGGAPLRAITGTSAKDVWAVGDGGTVLRWDGAAWARVLSGTEADLRAVARAPDGSVWIGGDRGTLLRLPPP